MFHKEDIAEQLLGILPLAGCTRSQYRKIEYAGLRDYLEIMFIELEEKIQEVIA